MATSVVIPSYRNPEYLALCLKSAIEHQQEDNQIIVVLDGFAEESRHVLKPFANANVSVIELEENRGESVAHNMGVTLAENEHVLIVNDDNVFPPKWDTALRRWDALLYTHVLTPNQMEPRQSIFKSFVIRDYGTTPETFDLAAYTQHSHNIPSSLSNDGFTWPLYISKRNFMMLGGIDTAFPHPSVADWDFFFRCEMAGLVGKRIHMDIPFYHFAGAGKPPSNVRTERELESYAYFYWKWGFYPSLDPATNKKIPSLGELRGFSL